MVLRKSGRVGSRLFLRKSLEESDSKSDFFHFKNFDVDSRIHSLQEFFPLFDFLHPLLLIFLLFWFKYSIFLSFSIKLLALHVL